MPILVSCSECDSRFRVQSGLAGKRIRCPRCHKGVITVPAAGPDDTAAEAPPPGRGAAAASPSPSRRTRPAERRPDRAQPCPQCDATIPAGSEICPKCGFHTKLGRRLSLGAAIEEAMRSPESGAEGAVTSREEKAARRVAQGWWVQLGMRLAVAGVLLLAVLVVLLILHRSYYGASLATLARDVPPLGPVPETFHPYRIGESLETVVPLDAVTIEQAEAATEGTPDERLALLARSLRLPVAAGGVYYGGPVNRILERAETLNGTFTREAVLDGRASGLPAPVWRQTTHPAEAGYLRGALLDFGDDISAFLEERERAGDAGLLRIEATLTMLPTPVGGYREAPLSYDEAVTNGMTWIRRPPEGKEPPEITAYDTLPERGGGRYYLHPVLLVHDWTVEGR